MEFVAVWNYFLCRAFYPSGLLKGEKVNLWYKCKKWEDGILYHSLIKQKLGSLALSSEKLGSHWLLRVTRSHRLL